MAQYNTIISPQGEVLTQVSKDRYLLSEKVRNYVLRLEYETGTPRWLSVQKATYKFHVSESYVKTALSRWQKWYYDNGVRHRPLELFIAEENGSTP